MAHTLNEFISLLVRHKADLESLGVEHAGVFGSQARGQAGAGSDVDILIFLRADRSRTVFDLVGIERSVAAVFDEKVDVAIADQVKPAIKARVLSEAVMAF